jgi:membrane protease YdiL (CAAX protease family)
LASREVKFGDILRLLIGALFAEITIALLLQMFGASRFLTGAISGAGSCIWWIVAYQRLSRSRGWESLHGRFSSVNGWIILASIAGALALIVIPWALVTILELAGIKIGEVPALAMLPKDLSQLPLAISFVVILGPFSEELLFRGLLLDWLKEKMAAWLAALIISVLFAFLHNNSFKDGIVGWLLFGDRFLMGVGASFLALRYGSLRPSFVMHATLNGCACIASIIS